MSKKNMLSQKCYFSAEEALNIIILEEYTLATSSFDDSSSESSYSYDTSDTNSQPPLPKIRKRKKIQTNTIENDMFYEHGKCHITSVSQTHVQPTSNIPTAPQTSKKSDTASTFDHSHDKCHSAVGECSFRPQHWNWQSLTMVVCTVQGFSIGMANAAAQAMACVQVFGTGLEGPQLEQH